MSHLQFTNLDQTVACVDHYLAELINAGAGLTQAAGERTPALMRQLTTTIVTFIYRPVAIVTVLDDQFMQTAVVPFFELARGCGMQPRVTYTQLVAMVVRCGLTPEQ